MTRKNFDLLWETRLLWYSCPPGMKESEYFDECSTLMGVMKVGCKRCEECYAKFCGVKK